MNNLNNVLELPIEKINLWLRACSCLRNFGINTVSDLINYNSCDLYRVRNLGLKCYDEVINKVHDLGLCFKEEKEDNIEKNLKK